MHPPLSLTTRALHWAIALGIVSMLALGWIMSGLPKGPEKSQLVDIHKSIGIVVGLLALVRIALRLREGWPVPVTPFPAWQERASHGVHALLLFATIAMPLTGALKSVTNGRPVTAFGIDVLPGGLMDKNEALHTAVSIAHTGIAYVLAGLIGVHVLAALKHHFYDRDATLTRMAGLDGASRSEA
jgi:cytochrome b561